MPSRSTANDLTTAILDFIYRQGGYAFRASSTGIFDPSLRQYRTAPKKGVSDILGCYQGRFLAIEIKIGKDRLSPEQDGFLKNIAHVDGLAFIARDFESFQEWWSSAVSAGPLTP